MSEYLIMCDYKSGTVFVTDEYAPTFVPANAALFDAPDAPGLLYKIEQIKEKRDILIGVNGDDYFSNPRAVRLDDVDGSR